MRTVMMNRLKVMIISDEGEGEVESTHTDDSK